jgi:hypothetical protein
MNSNDYYRAVLLGVVIGMASLSLIVMISTGEDVKPAEALEPKGTFTVVSQYKGCDVVQWHYSMLAEYKYFLDCTDDMRNK